MNTVIIILSLTAVLAEAQWNMPITSSDSNTILGAGQSQPLGPFGSFYDASSANYPGSNLLAAQLAPQFAQFGSHYPGYGIPNIPTAASSIYSDPRNIFDPHSMILPSQTKSVRQFGYQPGIFGAQTFHQEQLGQTDFGGRMSRASYGQFQGDDFMESVEKPASLPPSQPIRVIPPFMEKQSKEVQDKFYSIVQHPMWSPSEKNAKIDEMIAGMDVDVQNIYNNYQHMAANDVSAKRQKVHEAVAEMSSEAQQQFQKVSALMTNPGISQQERLLKIQDLYEKIPNTIKKEFDSKFSNL